MQFHCRGTILDIMPRNQLIVLVIYMFFVYICVINHVFFSVSYSCFDGVDKIWEPFIILVKL